MQEHAELRAELHRNPREVAEAAAGLLARARERDDAPGAARLLVVLGRARRSLGEIELAERDLREAVALGEAEADDELVADANLALAGVLVFSGKTGEAFGCLDTTRDLGTPLQAALAQAQHGVMEQVLGHRPQALARMDLAVSALRALGEVQDLARVLVNRGTVLTEVGDAHAAIADLEYAHAVFAADGQDFLVAQILHNLGYAHGLAGELPAALTLLDRAADAFRATGHDAPEVELDRVEVLLAAGLARDAAGRAESVVGQLAAAGDRHKEAVARLAAARAWTAAGDPDRGRAAAREAARTFGGLGQRPWQLVAELDALPEPPAVADLTGLAEELTECGNARAAARAYGRAALAAARSPGASAGTRDALVREIRTRAGRLGTPELRLLAVLAGAEHAASAGDRPGVAAHAREGLAVLDAYRATLAATDARAAVATHARDLVRIGLRAAVEDGDAAAALDWMDALRTSAAPGPPADPVLADGLTRLRALAADVRAGEAAGTDTTDALERMRALEDRLRDRSLAAVAAPGGTRAHHRLDLELLRSALDDGSLVAVAGLGNRLVAVRVDAGRTPRLLDAGPAQPVREALAAVAAGLRLVADPDRPPAARRNGLASARRGICALDAALHSALCPPDAGPAPLTLVMPPALQAVPWHLSAAVAGRPVVAAPSVSWWAGDDRSDDPAGSRGRGVPARALAVAGPRLEHAEPEARAVAAAYPSSLLLTGDGAAAGPVLDALAEADVAHLACHARSRTDSPLWSTLELWDGPVFGYDLERVARTPRLVVLSGCHTGIGAETGDRLLGLPSVFLDRGSRTVLGTLALLPDTPSTGAVLTQVHGHVASGDTVPAAVAAVVAQRRPVDPTSDDDLDTSAALAGLACFGSHR